jgi:uncharacterized protein HemX
LFGQWDKDNREVFVEIAKFVLTAIGTFLSVFGLSFTVFQYWKKKQDEKFNSLKSTVESLIEKETATRGSAQERLHKRIDDLELSFAHSLERRLSTIEGELKGLKQTLQTIQNWFVSNTPSGK